MTGVDIRSDWKSFIVEVSDHVATVIMSTERRGNLLGPTFWHELPLLFEQLTNDDRVRAIILTAAGPHFSYGIDLNMMTSMFGRAFQDGGLAADRLAFHRNITIAQRAASTLAECPKPVIAAVHGWCIGAAVDLVAGADMRFASADANFSVREVKVGIVADLGSLQRLPQLIGQGHTRELAMTGDDVTADRASRLGLVNLVLSDHNDLLDHAYRVAKRIASNPPLAVQGIKHVLDVAERDAVTRGLGYVATWNAATLPSYDVNEAISAVVEKRAGEFHGH
ncbi:crotonase/enoyl-CoA hydratase family protein [Nocardia sp. NPDC050408]|uniref:crotonase/enoyl-CoA hydratase family protein n=1 Tax=Nocardia sp. NPDC050408 TaxID=3364319 RepID=UPI0037873FB3